MIKAMQYFCAGAASALVGFDSGFQYGFAFWVLIIVLLDILEALEK